MKCVFALSAAMAVLVVFWAVKIWQPRPNAITGDAADFHASYLPEIEHWKRAINERRMPLWNPHEFTGMPSYAMHQHAPVDPLSLIYLFGTTENARRVSWLVHMLLGMGFYWVFLRRSVHVRPAAAAAAVLAFSLSGWAAATGLSFPDEARGAIYIPIVLYFADRLLDRNSAAWCVPLAIALAMQFFAGSAMISTRTGQFLIAYVLMRMYLGKRDAGIRVLLKSTALVASAIVLALGLAAVQFFPAAEASSQSARSVAGLSYHEAVMWAVTSPWNLFKNLIGRAGEVNVYFVGAVPLALACGAWLRRSTVTLFYLFTALITFALMLGDGAWLYALYYVLPGGDLYRYPFRFQAFFLHACIVLTALGCDATLREADAARGASRTALIRVLAAPAGALLVLIGLERALLTTELAMAAIAIMLFCAFVLAACLSERSVWRLAAPVVAIAGIVVPAFSQFNLESMLSPTKPDLLGIPTGVVDFLRAHAIGAQRVYTDYALPDRRRTPKFGLMTGLYAINGFSPLMPRSFWEVERQFQQDDPGVSKAAGQPAHGMLPPPAFGGGLSLSRGARPILDLTGVKYVVVGPGSTLFGPPSPRLVVDAPGFIEVYRCPFFLDYEIVVLENQEAWHRAFVVPTDRIDSLDDLVEKYGRAAPAQIVEYAPEHVRIAMPEAASGTLVLTDAPYPGWHVYLDGIRAAPMPVAGVFRGVRVTPDVRAVEFRYEPWSVRGGLIVSAIAAGIAVAVCAIEIARKLRRTARGRPA